MYSLREAARTYLAAEQGTLFRQGSHRVALCYPSPYRVAMSSLGYQVIYRAINARPDWACERAMLPDDIAPWHASRTPLFTLETQSPVADFDVVAFSVAFELELPQLVETLVLAGLPPLASGRGPEHPPVLMGGPITLSNALPLGPFADVVIMGDAEVAIHQFLQAREETSSKAALLERCADLAGFWVPSVHGDRVPDTLKVGREHIPAVAQIVTPNTELSSMFLIESSRGCPRMCTFCVVRATVSPMREADPAEVLAAIPEWAPRVGFVGAAVSDYSHIREVIAGVIARGKGVGVSSLRADRLDEDLVDLLRRGGYRTLTVASDAPSERMRSRIMKGIRERHLIRAAELARWAKLRTLKVYMILGLPGETDEDIDELVRFGREVSRIMPTALTLSPFVPKLHTPLCDAPFEGIKSIEAKIARIRKGLRGTVDVRSCSARWAWVEYRVSQGGMDVGLAALAAWRGGSSFGAWKRALDRLDERAGLDAAQRHGLWAPSGVDPSRPRPPRPPRRLPWTGTGAHNPLADHADHADHA